jgi:hypothetical protein
MYVNMYVYILYTYIYVCSKQTEVARFSAGSVSRYIYGKLNTIYIVFLSPYIPSVCYKLETETTQFRLFAVKGYGKREFVFLSPSMYLSILTLHIKSENRIEKLSFNWMSYV